ncbi:MAG: type I DNA topoisomerase [Parcubacteria group bacterium]|nr:type I DNA topoisomerase [Parcubacteria group bacterium]
MKLIIVESPTKSRTIKGFLGKGYEVVSSFGHIRDLPKGKLGIDVDHDFAPTYVIPTKARKAVRSLQASAKKADEVILATDEDREGEAIAFHLKEALGLKDPRRIVFHEITKSALQESLEHPRTIDLDLVNAQQARRILDRLVGYKLSPFLWKKVARGLSAGRVQSVALRLVADRENEIRGFKQEEYWTIEASLQAKQGNPFPAQLTRENKEVIPKLGIKTQEQATAILKNLEGVSYIVESAEAKETKRNPFPPFTTSTLQQTAGQRLRFTAKQTMQFAQQLYETGRITYHRTDSLNLSNQSVTAAESTITELFGKEYSQRRIFKTKSKGAQEAHEAIRPTDPGKAEDALVFKELRAKKLYDLIWKRFIASQMAPAVFNSVAAEITARSYTFKATGQTLKFAGFLKTYPIVFEETELPALKKGDGLNLIKLSPVQHFTQPPPRYTEATLIKTLEAYGVGRPSTYAPTLSTVQERGYVEKDEQRRFRPTIVGETVNTLLVQHFPEIVDVNFTARMEEDLDEIAEGKKGWVPVTREFYTPFEEHLQRKYEEVAKQQIGQDPNKTCPKCSSPLVIRIGRFGPFLACSRYPECKHTEPLEKLEKKGLGIICPQCNQGELTRRQTKRRKQFYGCSRFPDCAFALWDKPTGELCKACGSLLVEGPKQQVRCSNPACETRV